MDKSQMKKEQIHKVQDDIRQSYKNPSHNMPGYIEQNNKEESFEYTYSAKNLEEIERIRRKYLPDEEDKMEKLRRLDKSTATLGTCVSIVIGVVGTLLLGLGMSCTMIWAEQYFLLGVIIGIIGIVAIALAYPAFTIITKKQREKIAPQILALTEELRR